MPAPPVEVHVVSHTHWDRESYLTREQLRLRLVSLLDRVLDLMDADPRFQAFHLDGQTVALEDYLEVRPEQVVEVAFDGLQRSRRYPGGVALRFARVLRYRDDKTAAEADTIGTVQALAPEG